jgi:CHAD domain-containing protein
MNDSRTTHLSVTSSPETALAALGDAGFEFAEPETVVRTLLDTFDGRLHAAGLRLEAERGRRIDLVLSGAGIVPAHVPVASLPRRPSDVPPGPFRARLAGLVDVRALLPVLEVAATRVGGVRRDKAGKIVATAALYRDIRAIGADDAAAPRWTIEVEELVGYEKRARRARDVLDDVGLDRSDADTLELAAGAAGVDLAGTAPSATVPLRADMRAEDGVRAVLLNLAETVELNRQGTIDRIDPEFLHDLRVAVRRSRSVLQQARRALPPSMVARAGAELKRLGVLTGRARDLDVYLIEWDTYTADLGPDAVAALRPVRERLACHLDDAYEQLAAELRSPATQSTLAEWTAWLREPIPGDVVRGDRADRPLGTLVARRIQRAYDRLIDHGRAITPETPAERVHDLRKDAKRLRYLLECFASILPDKARKQFVKRLKAFQNILGEHQDAEVHMAELEVLSRELHDEDAPPDTLLAIGRLTEQLDRRRSAARRAFAEGFESFDAERTRTALAAMLEGIGS